MASVTQSVPTERSIADFYDVLASDYDAMTGFEKRFAVERPFLRMIVERYGVNTAVDAGCGTGFHSLLLTQLGVAVTAVDASQVMLEKVLRHAVQLQLPVKTVTADFRTLANSVHEQFDAVFCLGNSLAHVLQEDDLHDSLTNFFNVIKPDGLLFIQILNFDRILVQRERVQSVKEVDNTTFIRLYDFGSDRVQFNILTLRKNNGIIEHDLQSIPLRPLCKTELAAALQECGFHDLSFYGGIALDAFMPQTSKDLVVIARKGKLE